ncbi:MAG: hypothetical protein ACO1RX_04555 [Candidatus Sericytochromatia bacterium]
MPRTNLDMLQIIAAGLAELKEQVVFVGGAVAELYTQDSGAAPVRPTLDVDLIVNIVSKPEFASMEEQLRRLGFANDFSEDAPICRWLYQGLKVDVMPTDTKVLGFSNDWYHIGYERRVQVEIPKSGPIYILPPAIYMCTKMSATKGRGSDLIMSHDFEDLVYLISNCQALFEDIQQSDEGVRQFIIKTLNEFQSHPNFEEAITYSLPYGETHRLGWIQKKIIDIMALEKHPDDVS